MCKCESIIRGMLVDKENVAVRVNEKIIAKWKIRLVRCMAFNSLCLCH